MRKMLVLSILLVLFFNLSWADRLIVRGIYDANSTLQTKQSDTILGVNVSETKTFTVREGAAGIMAEIEFVDNDTPGFAFGLGGAYLADRPVSGVTTETKVGGASVTTIDKFSNAKLRYNYLFANLKYYLGGSVYLGAQYRIPKIELIGDDDWESNKISDITAYGLILGSNSNNGLGWELGYAVNSFLVNTDLKATYATAYVSLGVVLSGVK